MNRRERRAAGRRRVHGPVVIGDADTVAAFAAMWAEQPCADCIADVERWHDENGVMHFDVLHDGTCPRWKAMQ